MALTNDDLIRVNVIVPGHPEAEIKEDTIFWYINDKKFFKAECTLSKALETVFGPEVNNPQPSTPEPDNQPYNASVGQQAQQQTQQQYNTGNVPPTQQPPYYQQYQQVPYGYQPQPKKHTLRNVLLTMLGILLVAMYFTCPDADDHKDKLGDMFSEYLSQRMHQEDEPMNQVAYTIAMVVKGKIIDDMFTMNDYKLISVGKIKYDGKEHIATIGVLGNVIPLFDMDTVMKEIEKQGDEVIDRYTNPNRLLNGLTQGADSVMNVIKNKLGSLIPSFGYSDESNDEYEELPADTSEQSF